MNSNSGTDLSDLYSLLSQPLQDINIVSRIIESTDDGKNCDTTPIDRTFVCLTCGSSLFKTVVFFLGTTDDRIDFAILDGEPVGNQQLRALVSSTDAEHDALSITGISQFVNPVFNFGSELLSKVSIIRTRPPLNEGIIGVVLTFPFEIRFGLQIYDDYRLSLCFNDLCDVIVRQAEALDRVSVMHKELSQPVKPHYATLNWFDWLRVPEQNGE